MSINWSKALGQRSWSLLCGLGMVTLLLSGCSSSQPQTFADVPGVTAPATTGAMTNAGATAGASGAYDTDVFLPNQAVRITITDLPQPVPEIQDQIKTDGTITLLQNKTFMAAGKTRRQLEQEVHDYYVPNFYRQMTISIQSQAATRFYFVDGEVRTPDRKVYMGPTTVLKSIASAGGFTDFANKRKVRLIHPDGRVQIINCKKAVLHPELDLTVYPDDKVYVPRSIF